MPVTDGWLVGIAEINLPIEYKMKNIERTETEKQLRANAPKRPFFANLPSNMGTNFQQHRRGMVFVLALFFGDTVSKLNLFWVLPLSAPCHQTTICFCCTL